MLSTNATLENPAVLEMGHGKSAEGSTLLGEVTMNPEVVSGMAFFSEIVIRALVGYLAPLAQEVEIMKKVARLVRSLHVS